MSGQLDGCGCFFFLSARGKRGVAVSGCLFQDLLTVDLCDEEPPHPSFCDLPPPGCLVLCPLPPPCLQKQRPMGPVRVNFGVSCDFGHAAVPTAFAVSQTFRMVLCHPNIIGHPFRPSCDRGRMPSYHQPAACVFVCSILHPAQNVLGGRGSRAGVIGRGELPLARAQPQRSDLPPSLGFDPSRQDLV